MYRIDVNHKGHYWIYIGQFIKGTITKHGVGITIWDNGAIHQGYHKHGQTWGKARRISKAGNCFTGIEFDKKKSGKGIMDYADGSKYEGDYLNDK